MTMTTTSARLLRQSLLRSATRLQSARSMALRSTAASPLLATRASAAAVRAQPWAAQMPIAHFSSDADSQQAEFLDEGRFMDLADGTLHEILDWLDGVEVMLEDSDISFSQGVLKIDLGSDGTWVLNRQIPNRQIWWSSPISGPRRYEFDAASQTWINTRDKTEMVQLLRQEILDATGVEIYD